jgi:hypothetical protein
MQSQNKGGGPTTVMLCKDIIDAQQKQGHIADKVGLAISLSNIYHQAHNYDYMMTWLSNNVFHHQKLQL